MKLYFTKYYDALKSEVDFEKQTNEYKSELVRFGEVPIVQGAPSGAAPSIGCAVENNYWKEQLIYYVLDADGKRVNVYEDYFDAHNEFMSLMLSYEQQKNRNAWLNQNYMKKRG